MLTLGNVMIYSRMFDVAMKFAATNSYRGPKNRVYGQWPPELVEQSCLRQTFDINLLPNLD
jgi:hypothetical protein